MNLLELFARLARDPDAEAIARDAMVDALVAGCEPQAVIDILDAIRRDQEREGLVGVTCQTLPAMHLSDDAHHGAHWIDGWATNLQNEEPAMRAREVATRFLARFPRKTACIKLLSYVGEKNAAPGTRDREQRVGFFDLCLREVHFMTEFMRRVRNLALELGSWEQYREEIWAFKRCGYSAVQATAILSALHRDMQDGGLDDESPEMELMKDYLDSLVGFCSSRWLVWPTPEAPESSSIDREELFFCESAEAYTPRFLRPKVDPSQLERKCWLWPAANGETEEGGTAPPA